MNDRMMAALDEIGATTTNLVRLLIAERKSVGDDDVSLPAHCAIVRDRADTLDHLAASFAAARKIAQELPDD